MARTYHDVRLTHISGEDGERAFQHARKTTDRLEQVRLTGFLDNFVADLAQQLRSDLRICFGDETITFRLQVESQLGRVFDDAVVNDGDFAITGGMRMRIGIVRHAVSGPTGVSDAHGGFRHRSAFDVLHQIGKTTSLLADGHTLHTRCGQRHAGRIISAVFQSLKTLEADLQRLAARGMNISCISYDSTHSIPVYRVPMSTVKRNRPPSTNFCHIVKTKAPPREENGPYAFPKRRKKSLAEARQC